MHLNQGPCHGHGMRILARGPGLGRAMLGLKPCGLKILFFFFFFFSQETPHFHLALGLAGYLHEISALLSPSTVL